MFIHKALVISYKKLRMSVKERLKEYLKFKRIRIKHFEDSINTSNSYVNNIRQSISPDKLKLIKANYSDLNIDWLLTGEGEMITMEGKSIDDNYSVKEKTIKQDNDFVEPISLVDTKEELNNSFGNRFSKLPNGQYLMYMPLFEWEVAASLIDNNGDTRHPDYDTVEQYATIVDKPLLGKYSAFRIKGGSMEGTEPGKFIPDGSIVWGRELQQIHWRDKLRLSQYKLWIIGSTEFGRPALKEIISHDTETATIIVDSWNPSLEYAHNVPISMNTIRMLYYIMKVETPIT